MKAGFPYSDWQRKRAGQGGDPKSLLAETLEIRELLRQALALAGCPSNAPPAAELATPAAAEDRTPGLWIVRQSVVPKRR